MSLSPASLQTISQVLVLVGVIVGGVGAFGNYYYGKLLTEEAERKASLEQKVSQEKNLLDACLLGQYHFAYESFLAMKLQGRDMQNFAKETLSVFRSLTRKFKLPEPTIASIDRLERASSTEELLQESERLTREIFDFMSINGNERFANLYVLALSKSTYLKLTESGFPPNVAHTYKLAAETRAAHLKLPTEITSRIVDKALSYEDIVAHLAK